jgi:hypothetical protein
MKVGTTNSQIAINQACGKAMSEAVIATQPQWVQDAWALQKGIDKWLQPAVPLIVIGVGSVSGGRTPGSGTGGARPPTVINVPKPAQPPTTGQTQIPWTSWPNYPKVILNGREYAQVGNRLYTQHAVDRMQPSGLGTPAGATGPGRSISPNYIEDVIRSSSGVPVRGPNGESRLSYSSGSVEVITEGGIVITVITR